jgi:hypothetical protein
LNFLFFFVAETPAVVDPMTSTMVSVVTQMGMAGAAVFMAWMFLQAIQKLWVMLTQREDLRDKRFEEVIDRLSNQQDQRDKRSEEVIDRLSNRLNENTQAMREFVRSQGTICRYAGPSTAPQRRAQS